MNTAQSNIDTVKAIYDSFGKGDVPGILERLAEDVDWEFGGSVELGVPWLVPRRGRAGALAFFQAVSENLDFRDFAVLGVMGDGPWVTALVRLEAIVKSSGRTLREECEVHVWRFDDQGRVAAMRHAADTARHAAALRA